MSIVDNKNVEDRYVIQILRAIAICLVVFQSFSKCIEFAGIYECICPNY